MKSKAPCHINIVFCWKPCKTQYLVGSQFRTQCLSKAIYSQFCSPLCARAPGLYQMMPNLLKQHAGKILKMKMHTLTRKPFPLHKKYPQHLHCERMNLGKFQISSSWRFFWVPNLKMAGNPQGRKQARKLQATLEGCNPKL